MSANGWSLISSIKALSTAERRQLLNREGAEPDAVRRSTIAIVDRVAQHGDQALLALAREFDGVSLESLEVPASRANTALDSIDPSVRRALDHAMANIEEVHRAFLPATIQHETCDGVSVTRRADPLHRVGVYAPGGRAAYPSSVLMSVVPARVAGVREIVVCSPPDKSGHPSPIVLAAAALSGASRIFAVGGAGAIAAMAHGTESIPRVDRIVGPGNAYVACAKQLVSSSVGIDAPAGPSELLLIADGTASVDIAALEVLAQAEHDPAASVVVVSTDRDWLENLRAAVQRLAAEQGRAEIITASLNSCGALLQASDVEDALRFAEEFAPEHLLLMGDSIEALADRARNAGTIFVGATSSVTFGDYMTGANHVLPTGGLARSYSGLSTNDFFRWTTVQRVSRDSAARLATDTGVLALAEGLGAHAAAALQWRNT